MEISEIKHNVWTCIQNHNLNLLWCNNKLLNNNIMQKQIIGAKLSEMPHR